MDIQIVKDETPTEEQADAIREQVKAAIRDGKEMPKAEQAEPETESVDPWAGVPSHIRTEIESLRDNVKGFSDLSYRLKQAEQRIGSMNNKLSESEAARVAAEAKIKAAPTPEKAAEMKELDSVWEEFEEDNPGLASAIEARLGKAGSPLTAETLLAELEPKLLEKLSSKMAPQESADVPSPAVIALAEDFIEDKFPDYKEIIKTPEFGKFIESHPEHVDRCKSWRTSDAIKVLSAFRDSKPKTKTVAQIKEEQSARLRASFVQHQTQSGTREKSVDEMSPDEIREMVKKKFRDQQNRRQE